MESELNIIIHTAAGEDLYVIPYSVKHGDKKANKYKYYIPPEFEVNDTLERYWLQIDNQESLEFKIKSNLIKLKHAILEFFDHVYFKIKDDVHNITEGYIFKRNFKNIKLLNFNLNWFFWVLKHGYIFLAVDVFEVLNLEGQLLIKDSHKSNLFEDHYLTPTKKYFDIRLEEWLNEDVVKYYTELYKEQEDDPDSLEWRDCFIEDGIKIRKNYKAWRDLQLSKGYEIHYLYSLDT